MSAVATAPKAGPHAKGQEEGTDGEMRAALEALHIGIDSQRQLRRGTWADAVEEQKWIVAAHRNLQRYREAKGHAGGLEGSQSQRIPKIVHRIWLGGTYPTDERYCRWRKSWEIHNKEEDGWVHRLWTDDDVKELRAKNKLRNAAAFDAAANFGEKSDILRYEILLEHGGLYVDTDFECLRPFEELHTGSLGFYAGFANTGTIEINNGLIGAIPGHPLLHMLVDKIAAQAPFAPNLTRRNGIESLIMALGNSGIGGISNDLILGAVASAKDAAPLTTIEKTGPGLFTRTVFDWLLSRSAGVLDPSVVVFPVSTFFPLSNNCRNATWDAKLASAQSMAVHFWQCSWQQEKGHD